MERGEMLFDASTHMLFEASGDSEAEYFGAAAEAESGAAEDDAQSCNWGSSSDCAVVDIAGGDDFRGADFDGRGVEGEEEGGGCACEEEDGVVDQCFGGGGKVVPAAAEEKLNISKESGAKNMNDREADRLFWEACLASEKS